MTRLTWGNPGERFYETGTDRGVLYVDGVGVAWNGLVSVDESPSGGSSEPYYIDGVKYLDRSSPEEFEATLEAFTYPDAFASCDGSEQLANGLAISQQRRKAFGLVYRTKVGNDIDGVDHAYKLHIVYNAKAAPTNRGYKTQGDSADPSTFSWKITTRPQKFVDPFFGVMYGAHLVIDSRVTYPWAMQAVEDVLFGSDTAAPTLPGPTELLQLFVDNALLKIVDKGDGSWTAEGPDTILKPLSRSFTAAFTIDQNTGVATANAGTTLTGPDANGFFTVDTTGLRESSQVPGLLLNEANSFFSITWPSVVPLDDNTYRISSL